MLRFGAPEQIQKMFSDMEKQVRNIIEDIIQICYYMRGAVQYVDLMYRMTYAERSMVATFLNDRLEAEAKRINPVY